MYCATSGMVLDELVVEAAAQHREQAGEIDLLLVERARQQHVFVAVVRHHHDVGRKRADAQRDVVEVARRVVVRDQLLGLDADRRQLAGQQLGRAGAELAALVDDHRALGDVAGGLVDLAERDDAVVDADAEAGLQAEDVLEPAVDDQVGGADIDQERRVVLGGRLAGGDADRALEAADIGRDALPRSSSRPRRRRPRPWTGCRPAAPRAWRRPSP